MVDLPGVLPVVPVAALVAGGALLLLAALGAIGARVSASMRRRRDEREAGLGAFTAIDIANALANHEMAVHYQPVFESDGARLVSVEALLRWEHPKYGTLPARRFLNRADVQGSLPILGDLVVRSACVFARELQFYIPDLRISVNVAPSQLADRDFYRTVRRALDISGLAPAHLELEVSERAVRESEQAAASVVALGDLGVTVTLDDYWAGPSASEEALNVVRTVKVDLRANTWSEAAAAQIREAAAKARRQGLTVVAKRVETEHERWFQRDIGCDFVQGNAYGQPLPAPAFRERVARLAMATDPSPMPVAVPVG
jgi:EAL domain-containing protein (putative c-di-GMP-specific phosphodiesterase class I)